ncbi:hypothetical protein ACFXPA_31375 [Amycolatopsis sp. NPDC059090]
MRMSRACNVLIALLLTVGSVAAARAESSGQVFLRRVGEPARAARQG